MDLDIRIIEGKEPLNCFDINTAKQFIGKKGYFSDYLNSYTRLSETEEDVLESLDEHHDEAFIARHNKWEFFLPAEWVKLEKKYRPFTGVEFTEKFNLGEVICLKNIISHYQYKAMLTGCKWHSDSFDNFEVCLNGGWIGMNTLLNTYLYKEDNKWKTFGVEE